MSNDLKNTRDSTRVRRQGQNRILIILKEIIQELGKSHIPVLIGLPDLRVPKQIVLAEPSLELIFRKLGFDIRCCGSTITGMLAERFP